jgi:hypothetical protein
MRSSQLAAKNMRDEFPKATIEILAKRVGQRCSNPSCLKSTSGPHTEPSKSIIIGVAAHITAASVGGPRYDRTLSPEERRSPSNGIWLCQSCSKLVDSDKGRYSDELLRSWKERAEQAAASKIECRAVGSPQSSEETLDAHLIDIAVDEWRVWRNEGNQPGDRLIFVSQWAAGDICYSCKIRLRNRLNFDEDLHHLRIEFRQGEQVQFVDDSAFDVEEVSLPPRKWTTINLDHGLHNDSAFNRSDSVWFTAKTVGDNETVSCRLASLDG